MQDPRVLAISIVAVRGGHWRCDYTFNERVAFQSAMQDVATLCEE